MTKQISKLIYNRP